MNHGDWQRVKKLLEAARETTEGEVTEVLDRLSAGDTLLHRQAEDLLKSRAQLQDVIESPLCSPYEAPVGESPSVAIDHFDADVDVELDTGRRIGPYRIQGVLGRGGMGTVYLAVREQDFDHRVAIKLIHRQSERVGLSGLETGDRWARFQIERQVLAHLDHPNIARLLDGGTTRDGHSYLVMEHVEGERIDAYCNVHQLDVRQRLELFLQICEAVGAAHRRLIVHRDLKPDNILVTPEGHLKLLDFGIAKLLDSEQDLPEVTAEGVSPMTPRYASPEQVRGDVVTTTSDVYALGVLLYELLSGRPPYRVRGFDPYHLLQLICEAEPPLPSVAIERPAAGIDLRNPSAAEIASQRSTTTSRLRRRLVGDLDAIVFKAMRKEQEERYGSVDLLAEDLRRHLSGMAVRARQVTWAYRANKFLRRYKAVAVLGVLLLAASIVSTVQWYNALDARNVAQDERHRAEGVLGLLRDLLQSANPDVAQGRDLTVREVLELGRSQLADLEDPYLQAELASILGAVYTSRGEYDQALGLFEQAVAARRRSGDQASAALATNLSNLGAIHYYLHGHEQAEQYFSQAVVMKRQVGVDKSELSATLISLASTRRFLGDVVGAEQSLLELLRQSHAEDPNLTAALHHLGTLYYAQGRLAEARDLLTRALERHRQEPTSVPSSVASVLGALGRTHYALGDLREAGDSFRESLGLVRQLYSSPSRRIALAQRDLANLYLAQGRWQEAAALLQMAIDALRQLDPEDWVLIEVQALDGVRLAAAGRHAEAEPLLLAGYQASSQHRGDTLDTWLAAKRLVAFYLGWGRPEEAARYQDAAARNAPDGLSPRSHD